jgi:P-type Mg2+ transporter
MAAKLRAMVKTTASVKRRGVVVPGEEDQSRGFSKIAMDELVPGDIVRLSSGDMIPADLRLLSAKDLFINQAALTGETMPSEKSVASHIGDIADPFDLPNLCFMGGSVVSGFGTAVIAHTGAKTYFGQLADKISGRRELTSFGKGINRFTWLMIRFILVMVPAVLLINGFTKGDWLEALLFADLAKGAIAMSKRRVIVKRLHAIQNFGAMDVLCTDKTGTLTQDRIILKWHLDIRGNECERVLEFAHLNSHYQSGLKNLLDVAVLQHIEMGRNLHLQHQYQIIDEIPFDFVRRRLSVILSREDNTHVLICKGAVEEVFSVCKHYELGAELGTLDASHLAQAQAETRELNEDGFRVVAVAYKEIAHLQPSYSVEDENDLTLLGYIAFLDPPKETAGAAIAALNRSGVTVKIITGDNEIITRKICREVGLEVDRIVLGPEMEKMSDAALAELASSVAVFAKVSPAQKATARFTPRAMSSDSWATASTTAPP